MKLTIVMGLYIAIFLIGYFTGGIAAVLMENAISELKKNDEEAEKYENS